MKKLVAISIMAAMLLAIGVAAMASETNWKFFFQASSIAGSGGGSALTVGSLSSTVNAKDSSDTAGSFLNTGVANAMVYNTDVLAGTKLWTADYRAPMANQTIAPKSLSWDIYVWRMTDASFNDLKLTWTVGKNSGPATTWALPASTFGGQDYTYTISVISDPTGQNTGKTWSTGGWDSTVAYDPNPTLTNNSLSWTGLTGGANDPLANNLKGDADFALDADKAGQGTAAGAVVLRLTVAPVPEPSSMLALASGLFGMAGFAIRRRK